VGEFNIIKLEINDGTAIINFNRPEVYNALNRAAKLEIIDALKLCGENPDLQSIILTGEGKAFCTGQDLNDRTIQNDNTPNDLGHTLETEWNPIVNNIRKSKKIIVSAINGVVAGAGLSIAFAADLIISHPKASFISGFSKIGLCPDAGSTYTFTRALGRAKTTEFFLLNTPFSAHDFLECDLINFIDENPLKKAIEIASQINHLAPLSIEAIKENIIQASDATFNESLYFETKTQKRLGRSNDYQEGLKAFFEKRKPSFSGS